MGTARRYRSHALLAAASLVIGGVVAVVASADPPGDSLSGWPRQVGSPDEDLVHDMALSSTGEVYITGGVAGAFPGQTPQGGFDVFIARLDKFGRLVWLRQFGTSGADEGRGIVVSGSSIYVAGQTNGTMPGQTHFDETDGFVAKYDSNGNQKWVRQFGTSDNDYVQDIAYSNSDVYAVGHTYGSFPGETNAGPASTDLFVTRYSTSGVHELTYQYGTDKDDYGWGIAVTGNDTYVAGSTRGEFPNSILASAAFTDAVLARFDKSGNLTAHDQIGSSSEDDAYDVAVSGSQVYVTGTTGAQLPGSPIDPDLHDAFLIRYDRAAVRQWVTQLDGSGEEDGFGVAVRSGGVYITGNTTGALPTWVNLGGVDGYVARFGTNGIPEWTRQFGTSSTENMQAVAIRSSDLNGGAVVVAGTTYGTAWGQFHYNEGDGLVATFLA